MPLTKLVYLTLNLQEKTNMEPIYKRGDLVDNTQVLRMGTGGVILQMDAEHKGIIPYKVINSNFKGNYDQDELLKRYAKTTKHKVRILYYNIMEGIYVCTDDKKIVEEQYFTFNDLQAGDFVTAKIMNKMDKIGGYDLRLGKLKARIESIYLSATTKGLDIGVQLRCRVLGFDLERRVVYLTNRSEYMTKDCVLLTDLKQVKENAIFMGTIVQVNEIFLLVRFFNNIKGLLYKREVSDVEAFKSYYVGHTTLFRVVSRQDEQIHLGLPNCLFKMGELRTVTVINTLDVGLEISVKAPEINEIKADKDNDADDADDDDEEKVQLPEIRGAVKALLPLRLLSDFNDLLLAKLRMYCNHSEVEAVCIHKNIFSLRDVNYFRDQENAIVWRKLRINDIIKTVVKSVQNEVVDLMLYVRDYDKPVRVHWQMLLMGASKNINIMLTPEQVVYCRVLGKDTATKTISVSAKLVDVWGGKFKDTAAYVKRYLDEISAIRKALKAQQSDLGKYVRGEKVFAIFQGVHKEKGDWLFKLEGTDVTAVIRGSIFGKSKPPEVGRKQECIVLWIDYSNDIVYISNRPGDIQHISKVRKLPINLQGKSGVEAKVLLKLETVFVCSVKKGNNPLIYCPIRLHANDFECLSSAEIEEGKFCRLAFIHEDRPIAVLDSIYKLWQEINLKRKAEENLIALANKHKKIENKLITEKEELEINNKTKLKRKADEHLITEDLKPDKVKTRKLEEETISEKEIEGNLLFYEDKTSNKTDLPTIAKPLKLPGITDFWQTDLKQLQAKNQCDESVSSDDDNNDVETAENDIRKRKLTATEKFKQQQIEEMRLREIEEKNANPKNIPETIDQFDRLLLSDPNNSKNWINYMVFHLQAAEIDKARGVARRALKSISFRQTEELLNIWIALLNLELRYGTQDSYKSTLKEALTYNEPLHVYLRVLELLSAPDCNKQTDLLEIIGTLLRKFKTNIDVWRAAANAYFSINMAERAQQLLAKALLCLPEREHINLIVAFANMNHKYDHKELAHTLLDQVVTSYPKRVDVWTQYVDMLVKDELIDSARTVLERAITHKIPLKKMRTLFKKYLEFEERFGTEAGLEKVKQQAIDYVKRNSTL